MMITSRPIETKKSYKTPRLVRHGEVDKITQAVGIHHSDVPLGSSGDVIQPS